MTTTTTPTAIVTPTNTPMPTVTIAPTITPMPTVTKTPTPTPIMTNACKTLYYCYTPDRSCRLTSSTYEGISQKICAGTVTCVQNLNTYLNGKTTLKCFYYQSDCLANCL